MIPSFNFWKTTCLLILLGNSSLLLAQVINTDILNDNINWELRVTKTEWTRGTTDILDPDATPVLGSVPEHQPSFLISAAASTNAVPDQVNAGNICIQWNGVPPTTNSGLNTLIKTQLNTPYTGIDVDYRSWEDDAGNRCSFDSGDDDFMRIQKYYANSIENPNAGLLQLQPESFSNGSSSTAYTYWHYTNGNTLDNPLDFGTIESSVAHTNTNAGAPAGLSNAANFEYTSEYPGPDGQTSADVVYQFTINNARAVTISTNNATTNFDTYIHLLDASNNRIVSNNDASGTIKSVIQDEPLCSGTYKVVVQGNGGNVGTFRLRIIPGAVPPFDGGEIREVLSPNTIVEQGEYLPSVLNVSLPATTAELSYLWELSQDGGPWTVISNGDPTFVSSVIFSGCSMRVRRKAYFCTEAISAYSNTITFTQNPNLSGGVIASSTSLFACTNGKLPNIVSVAPAELDFATYRWQYHFGGDWQTLANENGLDLVTGTLPESTSIYYRRVATICGRDYPSNEIVFSKYPSTDTGGPIYVNDDASGSNNGSSWANAYTQLQDAIDEAGCTGAQIWVAAGTYLPTVGVSGVDMGRDNTFFITENISIFGGFAGDETSLFQRDFTKNRTILSGDLAQNDAVNLTQDALISDPSRQDNAKHVMIMSQVNRTCTLNGLEFTGGNFNIDADNIGGGAIFIQGSSPPYATAPFIWNCSFYGNASFEFGGAVFNQSVNTSTIPDFWDCTFDNNWAGISGGAVANQANKLDGIGDTSPTFERCRFTGNGAVEKGGAIYNDGVNENSESSPVIISCQFVGNIAGEQGGAIHNFGSLGKISPSIVNSIFINNYAGYRGGAIYNLANIINGNTAITNCSFYNNTAGVQGGAIYNVSGNPDAPDLVIANTILWNNGPQDQIPLRNSGFGNTTMNNSIYDDGTVDNAAPVLPGRTAGSSNLDSDPLFVDAPNGDLQLFAGSPAIDAGDDAAIPAGVATDLAGKDRILGSGVDMGAYENACASPNPAIFVDIDAPVGGDGLSWQTAFRDLQDGIDLARSCGKPVWVAEGTYYPTAILAILNAPSGYDNYKKAFYIDKNIQLYGGFTGTESSLSERDYNQYVTTLSGDFDGTEVDALKVIYIDGTTGTPITNDCILDGFSITGGNARFSSPLEGYGGGIYIDGSGENSVCNPSILNCRFFNNKALADGGAIYSNGTDSGESSSLISNCTFDNNQASNGSGGAIVVLGNSALQLLDGTFTNNRASLGGGAIKLYGGEGSIAIDRCTFNNNQSGQFGGAIFLEKRSNGDPLIQNSIFSNNAAEVGGGAVYYIAYSTGGNPRFTNCLYYRNTTNSVGGAIYLEGLSLSQPSFIHCTFYGNSSSIEIGGAIYNYADPAGVDNITFLNNCILWNNQDEIANRESARVILNYSTLDDGNPDGTTDLPTGVSGTNNLDSEPLFVDAANGDFHLQMSSPAINAGDNAAIPAGISTDLDGNNRIIGIIVDMGAYESTAPPTVPGCVPLLDFEQANTTTNFQYFANDNLEGQLAVIVANPVSDPVNGSSTVLAFTKTAAGLSYAGAFSDPDPSRPLDFTAASQLCVKVLMDHPGNISLKVEDSSTDGPNWIQTVENTIVDEWVELCFDVSANSLEAPFEPAVGNSYRRLTLFPDFGIPGTGVDVTTYFDDISVCNSGDGLCGDENLDLGGGDLTIGTYRGASTLTSANTLTEGPVIFTAGQSITLQAGFSAGPGVAFHAKIEDCIPAPNPNILEEIEVSNERQLLSGQLEMLVYPNPSSYETNIAFHLAESGQTSLEVYHSTGMLLQRLLDQEVMEAGEYTRQLQTTAWESGMYLVVLRSAGSTVVKKIMVVR